MTAATLFELIGWTCIVLVLVLGIGIPVLIVKLNPRNPERWL